MGKIRAAWRFIFFVCYTTRIVAEVYWRRRIRKAAMHEVMAVRRRWARSLLAGIGLKVQTEGQIPDLPCLLLANHRSYLDPIILLRDVDAFPVAKAEFAAWPVIGKGAEWAGIIFVQRSRSESRANTLRAITEILTQQQFPVILFPEGTTSDLPGMLPFQKGALKIASKLNVPVVPVAIVYENKADFWTGDASFLAHAWQSFQRKNIGVQLHYGPVIQFSDSELLETTVREWIESRLEKYAPAETESVLPV